MAGKLHHEQAGATDSLGESRAAWKPQFNIGSILLLTAFCALVCWLVLRVAETRGERALAVWSVVVVLQVALLWRLLRQGALVHFALSLTASGFPTFILLICLMLTWQTHSAKVGHAPLPQFFLFTLALLTPILAPLIVCAFFAILFDDVQDSVRNRGTRVTSTSLGAINWVMMFVTIVWLNTNF